MYTIQPTFYTVRFDLDFEQRNSKYWPTTTFLLLFVAFNTVNNIIRSMGRGPHFSTNTFNAVAIPLNATN